MKILNKNVINIAINISFNKLPLKRKEAEHLMSLSIKEDQERDKERVLQYRDLDSLNVGKRLVSN